MFEVQLQHRCSCVAPLAVSWARAAGPGHRGYLSVWLWPIVLRFAK